MVDFFISDPHFSHDATWAKFKKKDGTPLRPFLSSEDMNEYIITRINERVSVQDKLYILGDVVMNKKFLPVLERINCKKLTLVAGNHDIFNTDVYLKYFNNVRAYKIYPQHGIIFSHIPIHPRELEGRFKYNVHGHLHANLVTKKSFFGRNVEDKRYFSVCVEQTAYSPVSLDELMYLLKNR